MNEKNVTSNQEFELKNRGASFIRALPALAATLCGGALLAGCISMDGLVQGGPGAAAAAAGAKDLQPEPFKAPFDAQMGQFVLSVPEVRVCAPVIQLASEGYPVLMSGPGTAMKSDSTTVGHFTGAAFRTSTHWTMVLDPRNAHALEQMCTVYWPPLWLILNSPGQTDRISQATVSPRNRDRHCNQKRTL